MNQFDSELSQLIYGLRTNALNTFMLFITAMGNASAYVIIIPIVAFVLYRNDKSWSHSIEAFIILASSFVINLSLKYYFGRIRPDESLHLVNLTTGSLSFPSGHSMTSMSFYGFLIYLVLHYTKSKLKQVTFISILSLTILLIGFSRIYLGAHYPSDVLAGFIAGLVWLMICVSILRFYQYKNLKTH